MTNRKAAGISRRSFLATGVAAAAAPVLRGATTPRTAASFADVLRQPDIVEVWTDADTPLRPPLHGDAWSAAGVTIRCAPTSREMPVTLTAPHTAVQRVLLRWNAPVLQTLRVLGDAWERSYGELGWREMIPERAMPWYFLANDGHATHGYGVQTAARAMAFWLRDEQGISLWLDVRNGGEGVLLGERTLAAATILTRAGHDCEDAFTAACAFCKLLCPQPRLPKATLYGSNDWYYAYGRNTEDGILRDASLMSELAPTSGPRPFTVVDDGYQDPTRFPDLPGLAAKIAAHGAKPGIWIRPLRAPHTASANLLLPATRFGGNGNALAYDPTIPEARELALGVVQQAAGWGFELIKHDFTTWELLGQWGSAMGASPTLPGWHFYDRSRTNAEILLDLYTGIREAAGERIVLSCNAVGHLGAGLFEAQRTGDDVSGHQWERTRRTGVNTLGFRLPQHGAFFALDADCVAITPDVAWQMTQQWLSAVAQSGSVLLVSPDPAAMGAEQKRAVRDAFATVAVTDAHAAPQDWMNTRTPERWSHAQYRWLPASGASPFEV